MLSPLASPPTQPVTLRYLVLQYVITYQLTSVTVVKKKRKSEDTSFLFTTPQHTMKGVVLIYIVLIGILACVHADDSDDWDVIGEASLASKLNFIVAIKQVSSCTTVSIILQTIQYQQNP